MPPSRATRRAIGPNRRFSRYVKKHYDPALPILPVLHATTAYRFAEMMPTDEIVPYYCQNFKSDIVYLFYGRPAYKSPDGVNSDLEFNWPVVFVFDPMKVPKILKVFPFDTGAFANGLYREFFHKDSKLADFQLMGDICNAATLANIFYSNPERYLAGHSDRNLDIGPMEFEMQGLQSLNRVPSHFEREGETRRDERSTTIELQVGEKIRLKDGLLCLILPQKYMSLPEVVASANRWNPLYLKFYEPIHNLTRDSISGEIYRIVREVYRDMGITN